MDTNAVVASAAVGAVVASVTTLVVNQIKKANNTKAQTLEVVKAERNGYLHGWGEGREALLLHFNEQVTPQDFTLKR